MNEMDKYYSQPMQQEVVQFEAPPQEEANHAGDLFVQVLRRWPIIVLVTIVVCAIGVPSLFLLNSMFETSAAIRISPITPRIMFGDQSSDRPMPNYDNFKNSEAQRMGSDIVLERVADKLRDADIDAFPEAIDLTSELRAAVKRGRIAIEPDRRSEFITIKMVTDKRVRAEQIINAFIDSYIEVVNADETEGGESPPANLD